MPQSLRSPCVADVCRAISAETLRIVTALALNHITTPNLSAPQLIELAATLGCEAVELRLDGLSGVDDDAASGQSLQLAHEARAAAEQLGIKVASLSELRAFNDWNAERAAEARQLIALAVACGAKGLLLLPRNDGLGHGNGERQASLRLALRELGPMLGDAGLQGFIEPLGFERSSLRSKREVVDAIESLGQAHRFRLAHDTFHHHVSGGGECFAAHTGLVHISSVIDPTLALSEMRDSDRVLPDARDRLASIEQIAALRDAGYLGPISILSFNLAEQAPKHLDALSTSTRWLASALEQASPSAQPTTTPSRLVTSVT